MFMSGTTLILLLHGVLQAVDNYIILKQLAIFRCKIGFVFHYGKRKVFLFYSKMTD